MTDVTLMARSAARLLLAAIALVLLPTLAARAAVVAEGVYTISAPERRAIPFRMILTPTGARITPAQGETMVFSYAKKSALILDAANHSFFLLPLEFVPPLLAAGLGYEPRGLGASTTGASRVLLGTSCREVTVSGKTPRLTLASCRATDPGWSRDYALLEQALGLPWATAAPPLVFVGLPLTGSLEIEGPTPYRASWEITKISRDESSGENFAVPQGYRMDVERLLNLQENRR